MYESEGELENKLIKQLAAFGYEKISIKNISDLKKNLKIQLEKLNKKTFTENEFLQIVNHLEKGSVFEKAHILRDRFLVKAEKGEDFYIQFLKSKKEENIFQITHQVEMSGKYENRYDVTILINGLPLIQVELKRRGLEMKEAFNQINRYHKHSFVGTLFEYIQIFIISNGVDVKYFANNYGQSYEQTFF